MTYKNHVYGKGKRHKVGWRGKWDDRSGKSSKSGECGHNSLQSILRKLILKLFNRNISDKNYSQNNIVYNFFK